MFFDIIGALCSLLSTYLFIRLNTKAWIVGILATCLNGWLYWSKGIYADMTLEFCYFLSMGYGWYRWRHTGFNNRAGKITLLDQFTIKHWFLLTLSLAFVFAFIYYMLHTYTNSSVAVLDATTTSISLVAQWLMCHKIILTWILWLITDALYAFLYFSKGLPFHCILMMVYTLMAITGFILWTRHAKKGLNGPDNLT